MTPDFIRSNGVMTLNVYRAYLYLYLYLYSTLPRGGRDVSPPQNAHNRVVRVCCVRWTSGVCNRTRCQNPALRARPGPSEAIGNRLLCFGRGDARTTRARKIFVVLRPPGNTALRAAASGAVAARRRCCGCTCCLGASRLGHP